MSSHKVFGQRQAGSTLTGIIIGLVIGLAIAVVVALVITKTPTPFTNKNGKSDKTDLPVAQMQDPNKALYGSKDAVNQAAKEVAGSKAAETIKPATAVGAPASVATAPATPVAPVAASKPEVVDEKYIYYLQVGAFKEVAEAESARAKLALVGVEASVSEKNSDGNVLHRVRVGPFDHADAMNKMRAKLSDSSVDTVIVRSAK